MTVMDCALIFSLLTGLACLFSLNIAFDLRIPGAVGDFVKGAFNSGVDSLADYNIKRYVDRVKKEKIAKRKETPISRYNRVIEGLIYDFNMPLTLEGVNSLICITFALLAAVVVLFLRSVSLSLLVSVSVIVGLITFLTMQSRVSRSIKLESIMDAEDLICPLARDGVMVAVKKVLESEEYINRDIRPYFKQFVENCESHGYSFRRAMEILNRQLGPKFDSFARKAVIFEYNERKGMADIFLDIVDENAVLREVNARKNRAFRKMNRDFLLKTAMIVIFAAYSMTFEGLRHFMLSSTAGRFINTLAIVVICLSFARCQALQSDIGAGGVKK